MACCWRCRTGEFVNACQSVLLFATLGKMQMRIQVQFAAKRIKYHSWNRKAGEGNETRQSDRQTDRRLSTGNATRLEKPNQLHLSFCHINAMEMQYANVKFYE